MLRRKLYLCLLIASLAGFALPARADRDVVQFGSTVHVPRDTSIHDAVCFFCNLDAEGTVEGDVVVFFGHVHIGTNANHDVVNFFSNLVVDDNASIGQNLVTLFSSVRLGDHVTVRKDLVTMFGDIHAAPSVNVGGDRVTQPPWLFWGPLLLFVTVIVILVREIREHRRRAYLRRFPFPPQP